MYLPSSNTTTKISNRRFAFRNPNNPYAHILLRVKSDSNRLCFYCFSVLSSLSFCPLSLSLSLVFVIICLQLLCLQSSYILAVTCFRALRPAILTYEHWNLFWTFFYGFESAVLYQRFSFPLIEFCTWRTAVRCIANKSNNLKIIEVMCFCAFLLICCWTSKKNVASNTLLLYRSFGNGLRKHNFNFNSFLPLVNRKISSSIFAFFCHFSSLRSSQYFCCFSPIQHRFIRLIGKMLINRLSK